MLRPSKPENQMYPFFVMRQTSSTTTAVTPSPKGVNTTNQFLKGLTQFISPKGDVVDAPPFQTRGKTGRSR